jgi:ABC-2 type transport system permease protein
MINKTIFKQTLKSNFKIWLIITAVLCIFNAVLIGVFDPKTITSMSDMVKDTPLAGILGNTTFLGMLSQTFFSLQGIILPLIYIIITASSLVVSQVDKGSMAYLLSTPTKRSVVVRTQSLFFVSSLLIMFILVTIVGIFSIQAFHGGIWGQGVTEDVKAISKELGSDREELSGDLNYILDNQAALKIGAESRGIDEQVYINYLKLKITDQAYSAAAQQLGIDADEIRNNPTLIKNSDQAIGAASKVMGMDKDAYTNYLDQLVAQKVALEEQTKEMQEKFLQGVTAAAEVLGLSEGDLMSDIGTLKSNNQAFSAAVTASGIPEAAMTTMINNQLAANELAIDKGMDFNLTAFLMLNVGLFLLMFATSGISFMFSCIFNLSKNYMALGAGIPLAFFLFEMMAQVSASLDVMKYLTLNSLFDKQAILDSGNYLLGFVLMTIIGIALYTIGMRVFKEKDLPL